MTSAYAAATGTASRGGLRSTADAKPTYASETKALRDPPLAMIQDEMKARSRTVEPHGQRETMSDGP